jgi:hypothetical protein
VEISGTFYPQNLSWRDPCTCCYLIILLQLHRVPTPPLHADKEPLTQIHTADLNPLSLLPIIFTSMSVCASIWFTWHHTACLTQTVPPNSLIPHHHVLPSFPSCATTQIATFSSPQPRTQYTVICCSWLLPSRYTFQAKHSSTMDSESNSLQGVALGTTQAMVAR